MPKIRVLIVDDAVVVRRILTDALSSDPNLEVFTAANGRIALAKIPQVNPDIVTLDIEMPEMDGLATLKEVRRTYPLLPVIMFSTLSERGAAITLDALSVGANDYVTKPSNVGSVTVALARIKSELIPRIKALCGGREAPPIPPAAAAAAPRAPSASRAAPGQIRVVAIGVSTGGPNALSAMLPQLPRDLPVPVVLVQHMPPIFTKLLADRLSSQCRIGVREGKPGMILARGEAILAPGGSHMIVKRNGESVGVETNMDPPENSCRPAVDVLFRSVVACYGGATLGVILTGMGSDGLHGCERIAEAGGRIIVQDEASSVVWGMPGYVARAGLAQKILPLSQIAGEIVRIVNGAGASAPRVPVTV